MITPTAASRWRRTLTRKLIRPFTDHPDLEMALLGGSPARGLSDDYSDLDIVLYWKELDQAWLNQHHLEKFGCKLATVLDTPGQDSILEIYTLEGLIVEIGHSSTAELTKEIETLTNLSVVPPVINSIGGFLDALPLAGADHYRRMKAALPPYSKELATKVIERNLGFFWRGCLQNQGLARGEIMFVYDGISAMVKRIMNILAALNGLYFWMGEPRWIEFWASRMRICPADLWPRIRQMFTGSPDKALADLDRLLEETLALIRLHLPDVDMSAVTRFNDLHVRPTRKQPAIKKGQLTPDE